MIESRACILSVSGPRLTADEAKLFGDVRPWGVILMGRSCVTPEQVSALVQEIWTAIGREALIFIDQEGGRVRRLRPPAWPDFPAPGRYSDIFKRDRDLGIEAVWLHHRLIAAELAPMGLYADCAPSADLLHPGKHAIVGDRSLGDTAEQVAVLGRAALDGLRAGGVAGVIKHIPGHGRAETDSHDAMPVVRASRAEIEADLSPFRALNDAPMAMTAHIAYAAFDGQAAATVSPKVIEGVIRREIGFDGLLMTDDLGMKALGGRLADRGARAIAAGCDVLLHCSGFIKDTGAILDEMEEVAGAAPVLAGESLRRAKAAEATTRAIQPFDKLEGWERLQALLGASGAAMA